MNRQILSFIVALMFIYFVVAENATGQEVIKLGAIAPEGSDWGEVFIEMNAKLMEESQGQLRFQFYWGKYDGQLVNLIGNNILDAVSLTGTGLGNILSEAFIFQLPLLFSTYKELDYVRNKLTQRFEERFEEKGYILLGWGELGFVHLFSKEPIKTLADLQRMQVWAWDMDPIGREFIMAAGLDPVLLPIQNVLSSLENDSIQAAYTSPLACIAFGWHTEVRYMSDFPDFRLAAGIGATIMSEDQYNDLSDDHKALLRRITREYHEQLIEIIRERNENSISVLAGTGIEIKVALIPPEEQKQWKEVALDVQNEFVGELFPKELLDEVRELLRVYRR